MELPFISSFPETKIALSAALKTKDTILNIYRGNFTKDIKEDKTYLTEADLKSNEIIIEELSKTNYPILSEESKDDKERLNYSKIWIIDPLDGTAEFVDKTGEFVVMIALIENHIPVAGIVFQPTTNILYLAEKGKGAFKLENNCWSKIGVSNIRQLELAKVVLSRHHLSQEELIFLNKLRLSKFVQMGSCGLKIAEISNGKAELYFTFYPKIKQWDTAAGYCLITEAGGKITDTEGQELIYNTANINHEKGVLVTNKKIHQQVIKEHIPLLNERKE